jgi:hypothetical protein
LPTFKIENKSKDNIEEVFSYPDRILFKNNNNSFELGQLSYTSLSFEKNASFHNPVSSEFELETKRNFLSILKKQKFGELVLFFHSLKVYDRNNIKCSQYMETEDIDIQDEEDLTIKKPKLYLFSDFNKNNTVICTNNKEIKSVVNPNFRDEILRLNPIKSHPEFLKDQKIIFCLKDVGKSNDETKGVATLSLKDLIDLNLNENFNEGKLMIKKNFKTKLTNKTKFSGVLEGSFIIVNKEDEMLASNQIMEENKEKRIIEKKKQIMIHDNPKNVIYEIINKNLSEEKKNLWNQCQNFNYKTYEFNIYYSINNIDKLDINDKISHFLVTEKKPKLTEKELIFERNESISKGLKFFKQANIKSEIIEFKFKIPDLFFKVEKLNRKIVKNGIMFVQIPENLLPSNNEEFQLYLYHDIFFIAENFKMQKSKSLTKESTRFSKSKSLSKEKKETQDILYFIVNTWMSSVSYKDDYIIIKFYHKLDQYEIKLSNINEDMACKFYHKILVWYKTFEETITKNNNLNFNKFIKLNKSEEYSNLKYEDFVEIFEKRIEIGKEYRKLKKKYLSFEYFIDNFDKEKLKFLTFIDSIFYQLFSNDVSFFMEYFDSFPFSGLIEN